MKRLIGAFIVLTMPVTAALADSSAADRRAIEQLESRMCEGMRTMNVDKMMEGYIPDDSLLVFDIQLPRQYVGAKALRKDWEDFLATKAKSIDKCENSSLVIWTSGTLGASHFIQNTAFTDFNGNKGEAFARMTHVYQKIKGKWLVVHEHGSFPIDWTTGKADFVSKE